MAELHIGIFLGRLDDERAVVAKRGRKNEVRLIKIDHRLHRLGGGVGLGDVLFLDDGNARHLLENIHRSRMRLVPAEIVSRSDIDGAEHDRGLRPRQPKGQSGSREAGGAGLEK